MDETTVMWVCIWLLVVFNSFLVFHNLRKMYHRNVLLNQLQTELSNASPQLEENEFSTLVSYAWLH